MNLSNKGRKILGLVIIILAMLILVYYFLSSQYGKKENAKQESTTEYTENNLETDEASEEKNKSEIGDESDYEKADVSKEDANSDKKEKTDFKDLESPLKYELYPQIEDILDPVRFDQELCAYLKEKGELKIGGYEDNLTGIISITATPFLNIYLETGSYLFDLKIGSSGSTYVSVIVDPDGNYDFELK